MRKAVHEGERFFLFVVYTQVTLTKLALRLLKLAEVWVVRFIFNLIY